LSLERGRPSVRALVTGGAGFIGSHLCEALLARGNDVFVLDNLETGSVANIEHLKSDARFHCTIDSVLNERVTAKLIQSADVVFHLAAAVGVRRMIESPVKTIENNVRGTEIVLELADDWKKKVLLTSTSEVYGKSIRVPFREDDDLVLGPTYKRRWSYACSKAVAEFLALAYFKERRLPVVICRLFNTVGPRQTGRYGMVIPNFVRNALLDLPLTVYGDGKQSRCFTYVSDAVDALVKLAEHPEAEGRVVNVGNDRDEIRILDLACRVKERTGSKSEIVTVPYDQAYEEGFEDITRRVPDLTRIRALIGYVPKVYLDEILDRVVAYLTCNRERPSDERHARQQPDSLLPFDVQALREKVSIAFDGETGRGYPIPY
jgi:UDP-glucose 4-epimerase